jgi:uncharacterized membrane protein YeaQ/YmgE (transglycosylase-associated protein family)
MHLIGTIIIGFLAGVVAKLLTPGRDPGGFIVTTLLGIAGAFVATLRIPTKAATNSNLIAATIPI